MNWSFGIIFGNMKDLSGDDKNYGVDPYENVKKVIESIRKQNIENYEIILVGDHYHAEGITGDDIIKVDFDESIRKAWITKKKNIVAQTAKYENLSIHHDYITLDDEWYEGFQNFGYEWDVCMTKIQDMNGQRYRDFVTWDPITFVDYYSSNPDTSNMYISGGYFCVKRDYLLSNPLDETLVAGEGEDLEWSVRLRQNWNYRCNPNSKVVLCKPKQNHLPPPHTDPNK
tara:strand:- start:2513 stop:3196 length:684 start_codon:yes stop_codon:yes gene_type:complete